MAKVMCRKCGQPLDLNEQAFGSPETGWEHPFTCPDRSQRIDSEPPDSTTQGQ